MEGNKIGYARVSRADQNLNLQLDALEKEGCFRVFKEKKSGKNTDRIEFQKMRDFLRSGDTVIVWKLDRLGRTVKQLVHQVEEWSKMGVKLHSIQDNINTNTAYGMFFFHMMAAFAQLEHDLISERTIAGLTAARARGKKGGRPSGLSPKAMKKAKLAGLLYEEREMSIAEIADDLEITRTTVYSYLKRIGFRKDPDSGTYLRVKNGEFVKP